jgi:hypothetical protein
MTLRSDDFEPSASASSASPPQRSSAPLHFSIKKLRGAIARASVDAETCVITKERANRFTPRRRSDHILLCKTVQGEFGGGGNAQRRLQLARGQVIAPACSKIADVFLGAWMPRF